MAGRIETEVTRAVNGEERRRFGEAIAGCNQPAQSLELPAHFGLERRASRDDDTKVWAIRRRSGDIGRLPRRRPVRRRTAMLKPKQAR